MRYIVLIIFSIFILDSCQNTESTVAPTDYSPFAISYGRIENLQEVGNQYKLLIVESDYYSRRQVDSLNTADNTLLGYISLGEVNKYRWYYPLLEERGFLGVNENWDSPFLNLADSKTRSILVDRVVPNIMAKGFDGLFLDTIDDVAPYSERSHLQPHMVDMIAKIRKKYPEAVIVQNAGLFLLDQTQKLIDAVLIEDVATNYDFKKQEYQLRPENEYREKVSTINDYKSQFGKPFLILDFAKGNGLKSMANKRLDTLNIPYSISSIELDSLPGGRPSQQ